MDLIEGQTALKLLVLVLALVSHLFAPQDMLQAHLRPNLGHHNWRNRRCHPYCIDFGLINYNHNYFLILIHFLSLSFKSLLSKLMLFHRLFRDNFILFDTRIHFSIFEKNLQLMHQQQKDHMRLYLWRLQEMISNSHYSLFSQLLTPH